MKKISGLLFCFICASQMLLAQAAISYYPFTSFLGVSTNPDRRIWADFRILTNTARGIPNIEISPKLNLKRTDVLKIYVGVGADINLIYSPFYLGQYFAGYFISGGVMVSPFKKVRNLSFIFEISPYVSPYYYGMIRTNLGIAWHFKRKTKELPLPTNGNRDIE